MDKRFMLSLFTKPWRVQGFAELAEMAHRIGCGGIEFPLRKGYQVEPSDAEDGLPRLAKALKELGIAIPCVASETSERVFAGCAKAGVPVIRVMFGHDLTGDYLQTEAALRREIEGFLPLCERYGVRVGIQQHCGPGINNAMEARHLLEPYDPRHIGVIWDAAHSGLAGEEPEQSLDIMWEYLVHVNFKNAFYRRVNGPEARARYERHYTTGEQGLCSWPRAVAHLKKRGYIGNICLPAEYSDEGDVEAYASRDAAYLKGLLHEAFGEGCC